MADESLTLAPVDIVGIVQRQLRDLANYCDRPAEQIEPDIMLAYMDRIAAFVQRLPMRGPAPGTDAPAEGARAN